MTELLAPDFPGRRQLGACGIGSRLLDRLLGDAPAAQLPGDARCSEPAAASMQQRLDEARFGQPAALLQLIEQCGQCLRIRAVGSELGLEFGARVLAPCKQAQRPGAQPVGQVSLLHVGSSSHPGAARVSANLGLDLASDVGMIP